MFAGQNIKKIKEELGNTVRELEEVSGSLRETAQDLSSQQGGSGPNYQLGPAGKASIAGGVTGTSPRSAGKWRLGFKLICGSAGVGVAVGAILMHLHLEVYVWLTGGFLALPMVPWIAKALRGARDSVDETE
jgi:hypothetical protein